MDKENDKAGIFKTYRLFFCIKKRSTRHELHKKFTEPDRRSGLRGAGCGGRQFNVEILAERVRELKETQEGVDIMCRRWMKSTEKGRVREKRGKLGEKRGEERGIAKGKQEMAFSLLRMGMPVEEIARAASVSVELVEKWLEKELHPVG